LGPGQFALLEPRKRGGVIHSRQLRLILGFRCVPSCELGLACPCSTDCMTPLALRAGGAFDRNGPTSDVLCRSACTAFRFHPTRSTYLARPAARTPRKGRTRERIRTPSSYRACDTHASQSCFVLSLLDSARSKPHQFAFVPSRDASADSGLLLGLATFDRPRRLFQDPPSALRPRDASDRFLPPNQLRTTAPVLSVLDLRFSRKRGKWRFTTRTLASAGSPGFRRGVFALLRPLRSEPLTSLSLSGFPSHCLKWVSVRSIEPGRFFPRSVKNTQFRTTEDAFLRLALELSSVCTIPWRLSAVVRFSVAVLLGAASTMIRPCSRSIPELPALRVALAPARACLRRGMNEALLRAATSHRFLQHVLTHGHDPELPILARAGLSPLSALCFSPPACACGDSVRASHIQPRTEVGGYRPGRDLEVKDSRERGFPSFENLEHPLSRMMARKGLDVPFSASLPPRFAFVRFPAKGCAFPKTQVFGTAS
jgi:hypothetical protein